MTTENSSDSSTSESEVSACSSSFNPLKALYSKKTKVPVTNAPLYENVSHYESAQKTTKNKVIPVGQRELVKKREEEKERKKQEEQKQLLEKNKQRFAQYEAYIHNITPILPRRVWQRCTTPTALALVPTKKPWKVKNVLTRMETTDGPLGVLRECVDKRLRVKIITRKDTGIRGVMHASVIAFDKQWNMVLSDVVETWKRKGVKKRKIPPALGTPVEKGTAAKISPVPEVMETPLGNGVWECSRYISQLMVRGEHIVMVNVVER